MGEGEIVYCAGRWFVTGEEWSGPWASKDAAELAKSGEYTLAHEEHRKETKRSQPMTVPQIDREAATLRDTIAMHAMAAIIAKTPLSIDESGMIAVTIMTARGAYNYADAMMNNRSGNDAPNGWIYNGPDGEWYWSAIQDEHESVTDQRPATALEKALLTTKKDRS